MKYLVICSGLYTELANALADGGKNQVFYYTNTGSAFPNYKDFAPGNKFEHLKKVKTFWDYVDKSDCIVTFDVGGNDAIDYIRKKYPSKSVFGAGRGERLEMDRLGFKKVLESLNLPVIPYKVIKGMTNLRKYLESNPKKVVKSDSLFRGDFETLKADDYESVKLVLDDRAPLLGIYAEEVQFIVEDMVDCEVEAGFDGFFSGGEFTAFSIGIEAAKNLYVGKVGNEVPQVMTRTLDSFASVLADVGYAGAISTEERIVSKNKSFFIDPCCRCPLPLGVLYSRFIKNWPEVVYAIGRNEEFEIKCDVKYVGAFALSSEHTKDHFNLVRFDEGKRDNFRFMMGTQDEKGSYYAVKGHTSTIVIVAGGNSPKEVVERLKEYSEEVSAHGLCNEEVLGIDGIFEQIEKSKSVGIEF